MRGRPGVATEPRSGPCEPQLMLTLWARTADDDQDLPCVYLWKVPEAFSPGQETLNEACVCVLGGGGRQVAPPHPPDPSHIRPTGFSLTLGSANEEE